ncbi:MAG: radical SAM protein [Thermoleophilia bacterium]
MNDFHTAKAFVREEPRVQLIDALLKSLLEVVELEFEGRAVQVDGFRLRDLEHWRTAHETSLQQNLGSLSTACNCRCAFCYEDGNPSGLFEKMPRFVGMEEAFTRCRHLHDGRGLFRENKGFFEPLINPDFLALQKLVREQEPESVIDVTTNGALLSPELIASLSELKPIVVNVSLISSDEPTRQTVMADPRAGSAIRAIELLRAAEIPFMGTLVPLPQQGLDDVERTLEYMDANEARMVRVSMPGLTGHHPRYEPGVIEAWVPRVVERVLGLRARLHTPVVVSPYAHVSASMDAIVEGVIRSSPAAAAGIEVGDRVVSIDGKTIVSRAHAVSLLKRGTRRGVADVEVVRGGSSLRVRLEEPADEADAYPYKPRGWRPLIFTGLDFGLCLPGSFHLQYLRQIHDAVVARGPRRAVVAASPFFRDLVAEQLAQLPLPEGVSLEVIVPRSRYFGGTVSVGDLWVLEDIEHAMRPLLESASPPDLLLLPNSFLSQWGRDLRGVPYPELEAALGIDVVFIDVERIVL